MARGDFTGPRCNVILSQSSTLIGSAMNPRLRICASTLALVIPIAIAASSKSSAAPIVSTSIKAAIPPLTTDVRLRARPGHPLEPAAYGRSAYDGSWDLVFVTQRGTCDSSYSFTVDVTNGIVTHPNLVKFRGYVTRSGAVRATVTVHDKYAAGTGKLFATTGRGTWSGHSGSARCSGYWSAQRN